MVRGEGPAPSLVLSLVQRLPEGSLTHALVHGNREFFGWTRELAVLSDLFDALNINTRATGMWEKGKAPELPSAIRPGSTDESANSPKPKTTVAALYARWTKGN